MLRKIAIIFAIGIIWVFSQDKTQSKGNFDSWFEETNKIVWKILADTNLAHKLIWRQGFYLFAQGLWEIFSDSSTRGWTKEKIQLLFLEWEISKAAGANIEKSAILPEFRKYLITFSYFFYCLGNKQGYESGSIWAHKRGWCDAVNQIKTFLEDSTNSEVKIVWHEDSTSYTISYSPRLSSPPVVFQSPPVNIYQEDRNSDFMQNYYQQQMLNEMRRFNDLLEREEWRKLLQEWSK